MSLKKILACMIRADLDYNLIDSLDRIAVGVSGGKDSMLLLKAMKQYQKYPIKQFDFVAVYLDLGFGNVDRSTLTSYCASIDVPLHIENCTEVFEILKQHKNATGNLPCSICSRMKKAAINKAAHRLGCNKVAFAHHCDDAIETLLMNTIYGGRIATFSPKMHLSDTDLVFIRPFSLVREKDIISACHNEGVPIIKSACPNDHVTMREEAKKMLSSVYDRYPMAYNNYRNMLSDRDHFDLWTDKKEFPLSPHISIRECLSQQDFFDVISIRTEVFVREYRFPPEEEFDGKDGKENAHHYIIRHGNQPIGTISYIREKDAFTIRRFALLKAYRNRGIGSKALSYVEGEISTKTNPCLLYAGAVKSLQDFYKKMGYRAIEEYEECGTPHVMMTKEMKTAKKYRIRQEEER